MGLFNKPKKAEKEHIKIEDTKLEEVKREDTKIEEKALDEPNMNPEENVNMVQLLQCDVAILEGLQTLCDKVCEMDNKLNTIDRNNKKFLMSAAVQKTELLEKQIADQKMNSIYLLDQIDVLVKAIQASKAEDLKQGLVSYRHRVLEIVASLGLEEIEVKRGMEFNSKEHDCKDVVHVKGYENDIIIDLLKRGYKDRTTGAILRYAHVTVNKVKEEQK